MQGSLGERCQSLGLYMVMNQCTVRQAAVAKGLPKSTVHKDVTKNLKVWNYNLYVEVRKLLDKNKAERHIRGGEATKRKYQK